MHQQFVQITAVNTSAGVALYALDNTGKIFEKLVGQSNATWTPIL